MRCTQAAATGMLMLLGTGVACRPHRPAAPGLSAAAPVYTDHCWWSTNRSALPPDSVAARFRRAYAAVGFAAASSGRQADTAWAQTAATVLPGASPAAAYAMWAVAYRSGDSTHYRYFVAVTRLPTRPAAAGDEMTPSSGVIPLCVAVARAAAIPGVQPPQPTGEEALGVWRRRP